MSDPLLDAIAAVSDKSPAIKRALQLAAQRIIALERAGTPPTPTPTPTPSPSPPPPPPTTGHARFGITNNVSGSAANGQAVLDIGARLIREDSAAANAWAKQHGIDVVQIVYPGNAPALDSYAHEVVACSVNEPYMAHVDPRAWAVAALAEVKRVRAANLGRPILLPLVSTGAADFGGNGQSGTVYPGEYAYPNGGTPWMTGHASWVRTIDAAAPGLLAAVDGFSVHPYFNDPPFHVLDTVRAELTALGHTQPFWITEYGQCDDGSAASEAAAAATIAGYVAAVQKRTDVAVAILYRLGEALEGGAHWGILRADGTTKPAYVAYRATIAGAP